MPMPTISVRYDHFKRAMVRLLGARCCDCELVGLEVLLARANEQFVAALPHFEQMERGCTRSDLGELQCALIDKAWFALLAAAIAIANEVGMSLTRPMRLGNGRTAMFDLLGGLAPFLSEADANAHAAFTGPAADCNAVTYS
jgi:hypothetical protein